jgi:hypothetical protein
MISLFISLSPVSKSYIVKFEIIRDLDEESKVIKLAFFGIFASKFKSASPFGSIISGNY